jgi:3alpha(or 20beta)-hydroxysteroid dehydrogenase
VGRVEGKVALITGGARGMGADHARLLVSEGAKVVIGDVLDDEGRSVATQLGDDAHYLHLDVTQPEQWTFAVDEAVRRFGRLDVLVNNAGVAGRKTVRKFELDRWRHTLDVNLTGTFLGTQAVVARVRGADQPGLQPAQPLSLGPYPDLSFSAMLMAGTNFRRKRPQTFRRLAPSCPR